MATYYRRSTVNDLCIGDSASHVLVRTVDSVTGVVQGQYSAVHPPLRPR